MPLESFRKRLSKLGNKKSSSDTSTLVPPKSPTPRSVSPAASSHFSHESNASHSETAASLKSSGTVTSTSSSIIPVTWPVVHDILPQGGLQALVYHHKLVSRIKGEIYCWTFISKGLSSMRQKEVVFTIRRKVHAEREKDFPKDPFSWFELLYSLAKQGQVVHEFEHTDFHTASFLGRSDIRRVVYCASNPIDNVPASLFPQEWMQIIPLVASEAEVAQRYGVMRALSHLGASARWFPFPPWFDRERGACVTMANMNGSVKASLPCINMRGVSALKKGPDVVLHISEEAEPLVKEALRGFQPNLVFPLNTVPHKNADSGLLWDNRMVGEQPQAYAAGKSSSCMNLNFFAFCPGQQQNELKLVEDGYVFMLRDVTWMSQRKDIENSVETSITLASGGRFSFEFGRLHKPADERAQPPTPAPVPSPVPAPSPSPSVASSQHQRVPSQPPQLRRPPRFPVQPSSQPVPPPAPQTAPRPGFSVYTPQNPLPASHNPSHIHCDHVVLLDNNIKAQPDVVKISDYIKRIEQVLDVTVPKTVPAGAQGGGQLVIEADVGGPDRWDMLSRQWLKWRYTPPALEALPMNEMYEKVSKVPKPDIEPRTRLQLAFNVWGYQGTWT